MSETPDSNPYSSEVPPQQQSPAAPPAAPAPQPAVQPVDPGAEKTNTLAIVGFVSSFIIQIVGLIVSIVALVKINKTGEKGKGFAIAGIIISVVLALVWSLVFATIGAAIFAAQNSENAATSSEVSEDPITIPDTDEDEGEEAAEESEEPQVDPAEEARCEKLKAAGDEISKLTDDTEFEEGKAVIYDLVNHVSDPELVKILNEANTALENLDVETFQSKYQEALPLLAAEYAKCIKYEVN